MPVTGTKGAASSQGFGEFAKVSGAPPAVAGFISNLTTTAANLYIYDMCTDGAGNYYLAGGATSGDGWILKVNSSGVKQWSYIGGGGNAPCSLDYYNGNVYWLSGQSIYVVPVAGATSITKYSTVPPYAGTLRFDTSGNMYVFGSNYFVANVSLGIYKYSSTGTAISSNEYYNASYTDYTAYPQVANFNPTRKQVTAAVLDATFAPTLLFSWTNGSVDFAKTIDFSTNASTCADNSGNVYCVGQPSTTSRMYLVALDASGNILYRKWLNGMGSGIPLGGQITCDNLGYLYVVSASTVSGYQTIAKLKASDGSVVWAKSYSTYTSYPSTTRFAGSYVLTSPQGTGNASPAFAIPYTTGGANGTYASCVVASATVTPTAVTPAVNTATYTSVSPSLVNLTAGAATLTSTTTIISVASSASITV